MQQCKLLKEYQNGNYKVRIYSDGSKIRFSTSDSFNAEFPESIDLKITNRCDLRCPMCHEKSTPSGKDGDLNHPFFETLVPGTEIAIGGGNPFDHRELIPFLERMKERGIICNITVNQIHLFKHKELIQRLIDEKLIYGIGISVIKDLFIDEVIDFSNRNPNSVIHLIVGIIDKELIEKISNKGLKILFLGYKYYGRGRFYFSDKNEKNMNYLKEHILEISEGFEIVSFDNSAIIQLDMEYKVENFEELYMGDDGEFTMYIDLVKKQCAVSSTSDNRFPLMDNIKEMFNKVKDSVIKYHVEYYLSTDEDEMLFATLKEDHSTSFYFDEENDKWEFSGLVFDDILRPTKQIDKNEAIFIANFHFVEDLYRKMFGIKIYREKEKKVDPVDDLINSFVDFAKGHYKYGVDKNILLNLSARDLENAYHCGYFDLIEQYYLDVNNKDYDYIKIEKMDDDYIVRLDEKVLK